MYNHEIKDQFVRTLNTESRRIVAYRLFNLLEPYEDKWGADVCTVNKEQLIPVLEEMVGIRRSTKKTRLTILSAYAKWCIKNGVPGACDALTSVDVTATDRMRRQTVSSPLHLQRFLDMLFADEDLKTVDCIYRCYCWLAYSGFPEEKVLELTAQNVDFMSMVFAYEGQQYPFYKESIKCIRQCAELDTFRYIHPLYDHLIFKDRAPGKQLLRGMKIQDSPLRYRTELSHRIGDPKKRKGKPSNDDSLDLKLSYYRIKLSGLFYRQYEAERAGMPVDFMAAAGDFMMGKEYRLESSRNTRAAKQRQVARDYTEDYEVWKSAYNI